MIPGGRRYTDPVVVASRLEAEYARIRAAKIVELCVCVNGDNPPPDCPCVICTVRRAEARIRELDMENTRLRAIGQVLENRLTLVKAMHRAEDWPSRNPVCGCCGEVWPCPTYRDAEGVPSWCGGTRRTAVNQAEAWEKAAAEEEARAQKAEARLEAVKATLEPMLLRPMSTEEWYKGVRSALRAAEGKP